MITWKKRAQFFLIAALIISAIILSFGKVYNISRVESFDTAVYDFSRELQYETSQVIDNGLFTNQDPELVEDNLEDLTEYYGSVNPDSDISIIFGDESDLKLIDYNSLDESVTTRSLPDQASERGISRIGDVLDLRIVLENSKRDDNKGLEKIEEKKIINRKIDVKQGQNFYVVIKKKISIGGNAGEQIVISR